MTDQTSLDRLTRWRDVGDGDVAYTAGSKQFANDVVAILAEIELLRGLLRECSDALYGVDGLGAHDDMVRRIRCHLAESDNQQIPQEK